MEEQSRSVNVENMNRRDLVKNVGLATLGMIYTRPAMETIMVESAFASYGSSPEKRRPLVDKDPDLEEVDKEVNDKFKGHVFLRGIFQRSP